MKIDLCSTADSKSRKYAYGNRSLLAGGLLALLPLLLTAPISSADPFPQDASAEKSVDARPGAPAASLPEASGSKLALSLEEATRLALSRNLDLVVNRIDADESRFRILEARGVFDPALAANLQNSLSESPSASVFQGSESKQRIWNLSVSQLLAPGTTYSLAFDNNRLETNSSYYSLNPSFSSSLSLTVTQPLLRNFGFEVNEAGLLIARNNREISREAFLKSVQQTIVDVENAYWDVVAAREELAVQDQSVAVANDLLRITKIKVDVGSLAPIEIVSNESAVASREEAIIRAAAAVENAEDRLRRLVNVPQARWEEKLELTDSASGAALPPPAEGDLADAFKYALENRPEMIQARLDTGSKGIKARYDRNQTLPSLDLTGKYGFAGIAGDEYGYRHDGFPCDPKTDPNCRLVIVERSGYGHALSQIKDRDFHNWTVAVSFGIPVFNWSAKARSAISRLELERSEALLSSLEQQVLLDVRLSARAVLTAQKSVAAAAKARILAERNLDAERKKFENGMTTNFEIIRVQELLSASQSVEVGAKIAYKKALTDFHRAKGDLVSLRGVRILDDEPEPVRRTAMGGGR